MRGPSGHTRPGLGEVCLRGKVHLAVCPAHRDTDSPANLRRSPPPPRATAAAKLHSVCANAHENRSHRKRRYLSPKAAFHKSTAASTSPHSDVWPARDTIRPGRPQRGAGAILASRTTSMSSVPVARRKRRSSLRKAGVRFVRRNRTIKNIVHEKLAYANT